MVYASFVFHSICREQWIQPATILQYGLQRVEMLNADASQGFAFDARGDVCEQMGQLGKNFRTFIQPIHREVRRWHFVRHRAETTSAAPLLSGRLPL